MRDDYPSIAAGIVTYNPDTAQLYRLVKTLSLRLDCIYLFNNAPLEPSLRDALTVNDGLRFIDADGNFGVGVGLNVIALAASRDGFERLIVFDQDSRAWPGMIERLEVAFDQLEASRRKPVAVGPRLVAPSGDAAFKAPAYRPRPGVMAEGPLQPVEFLPTSGSLFNLRALRETGLFRADYFIDAIDLEWSFRAWSRGVTCWLASDVPMEHTVGQGVIDLPFGLKMPSQKPFRMYCHLRNTVYGFRLAHVPLRWKLKQAVYMALQIIGYSLHHRFARGTVGPLFAGLRDGLLGRLGPPPEDAFGDAGQSRSEP